jgi:hypothetical protein
MLISDISYLEVISEENIEGSGRANFRSSKTLDIVAQSDADASSDEELVLTAETGFKAVFYSSSTTAVGLT